MKKILSYILILTTIPIVFSAINWDNPTPDKGEVLSTDTFTANVSINWSVFQYLKAVTFEFNGTNQTYYDDTLNWAFNFDNISTLGEDNTQAIGFGLNHRIANLENDTIPKTNGKKRGAIYFDGVNDHANVSYDSKDDFLHGNFTLLMWAQCGGYSSSNHDVFISQGDGTGTGRNMLRCYKASLKTRLSTILGGANQYLSGANSIAKNTWYYMGMTWNNDTNQMCGILNGETKSCVTIAGGINEGATGNYVLGTNKDITAAELKGYIDELRIFNRFLTADEITNMYNHDLYEYVADRYYFDITFSDLDLGTYSIQSCDKYSFIVDQWECTDKRNTIIDILTLDLVKPLEGWVFKTPEVIIKYNATGLLDTCILWGDFSGSWEKNESNSTIESGKAATVNISLSQNLYNWNVSCNSTFGTEIQEDGQSFKVITVHPSIFFEPPTPTNRTWKSEGINISVNSSDTWGEHQTILKIEKLLAFYIPMDDYNTGGILVEFQDISGNNYHGDANGGPYQAGGKWGLSAGFDGIDDFLHVPELDNGANYDTYNWSVSCAFRYDAPPSLTNDVVIGDFYQTSSLPTNYYGWNVYIDSFSNLRLAIGTKTTKATFQSTTGGLKDANFHSFTVVYRGYSSNYTFYIDGAFDETVNMTANLTISTNRDFDIACQHQQVLLGGKPQCSLYWDDAIDTCVFDRREWNLQDHQSFHNATLYQYDNNLTLEAGLYNITAYADNEGGNRNNTETRSIFINSTNSCDYWVGDHYIDCPDNCDEKTVDYKQNDVFIQGDGTYKGNITNQKNLQVTSDTSCSAWIKR